MSSLRDQLSRQVYSTEQGDLRKQSSDTHDAEDDRLAQLDGIVRIRREKSGRKGKGVTVIQGLPLREAELKPLLQALKKRCGSGGALKDGVLEIQGDHRDTLKSELERRGYTVKLAGG
ncbi:stress response translation initiation inhibitor YciH [Kushneria phosphatilytica]|uniref:Stress response translation initiation inhibitor YciH n=1 Tax=Kushneria phosphatilytica TaxID=657387 RepID=A0A1S1NN06_9GAMM|nr:stress response translation initiation inhibitor YciH [Kushneria phosphatilytica]OHV08662.1 translation initiation factor [Kushneria phosphatilytica]QEL12377.1 stress response translation initiation inhibitor YciH [Kushneria phosphatilytica]